MAHYRGKVSWFSSAKGYGFLSHDGRPDVFVHYSAIESEGYKALKEGELVEFDIETGAKGKPQAARVRRVT